MRDGSLSTPKSIGLTGFLNDVLRDSRPPLIKLFGTDKSAYLYDTGTNRIMECSELEVDLITNILTLGIKEGIAKCKQTHPHDNCLGALRALGAHIEKENILKTRPAVQFGLSAHFGDFEDLVANSLRMIILEVTERCNLRCKYCIYDPSYLRQRNHGTRDMDETTAFGAIRYLSQSSRNCDDLGITFYGGEPLLRFPMVRKCVDYAKRCFADKKIIFSLTTNGTLLTQEMARFFAKEHFGITVSIDGPDDIHDQYRLDPAGIGSYRKTIAGLGMLIKAGIDTHRLRLSMVYAPPFSMNKVERIAQLWNENPWLPKDLSINVTYAEMSQHQANTGEPTHIDHSLLSWAKQHYLEAYKKGDAAHPLATGIIEANILKIVQRPIFNHPLGRFNLNGCCIPCSRKVHVSVDGGYSLCERIGSAPKVGSVSSGIDLRLLKQTYVDDYSTKSLPACAECWAIQLCGICYAHAFKDLIFDFDTKYLNCLSERFAISELLKLYCELIEINPDGLDHLMEMKIA